MDKEVFSTEFGGKKLVVKTTNLPEQTSGACMVQYGDTVVMANVVMSSKNTDGLDYFPLTVEYEEKFYAAGRIFGSRFIRREGRPTDEAVLTGRMIDRAIRPRFPKDFKKEVQVIVTCLSWDGENDPDIAGLIATSFALTISEIPFHGPIGAVRIGRTNGEWIVNPSYQQRIEGNFDLTLAGIEDNKGKVLVNMIEMGAKETTEQDTMEAVKLANKEIKSIIDFQKKSASKIAKEKIKFEPAVESEIDTEIRELLQDKLDKAITHAPNDEKNLGEAEILKEEIIKAIKEKYPNEGKEKQVLPFFEKEMERIIIRNILEKGQRPDGRKLDEIRPLSCEVGVLPRTHGTGIFMRGLTRVLSILTLGGPADQQILEGMEFVGKKRFLHHYNFPPYSTGETGPMRGPKSREIGHGNLAEKALLAVIPNPEEFPYTIRIVSEVMSSNGSTSMASTCASCLALMDAGVPIKSPVAGISIGLAHDEQTGKYELLTDIQGPEDHFGDMDFKVAGTKQGITAVQMDTKIDGISEEIFAESLERAKTAKMKILDIITAQISEPRKELSPYAPKIASFTINPEKIGEVVGPKGSVINKIIDACNGIQIDIEDSGFVSVTGQNQEDVQKAVKMIKDIVREVMPGEIFEGTVRKIMEFGAFVDILPGQSGMVHISKFTKERLNKVTDVVKEGDKIPVKVIGIDDQGRINLSAVDAGFKPKK